MCSRPLIGVLVVRFARDRLHITEVLQPLQNGLAGPPGSFARSHDRFHTVDRVPLHIEIESCISAGGRWAGVSKPLADGGQVHAGLQKGHRSAVSHAVRVQTFPREARDRGPHAINVFGQDVSNSEARQARAPVVQKHSRI